MNANVYEVPEDAYLVLADNLADVSDIPDVRWSGVVVRASIVARLSKWSEASRDKAVARRFLERLFANMSRQMPLPLNEAMTLTSIAIDDDNRITYAARIEGEYQGPLPIPEDKKTLFSEEVRQAFCQSHMARYSDHLQLLAVISDQTRELMTVPVTGCEQFRRGG
ncbi:hypothetical protein [Roseateles chitinivorans]|uniref:hypothetical protein n=1 Tax=Roseateles chitinivorans TaxID=2917965 RepID=UPI003D66E1CE